MAVDPRTPVLVGAAQLTQRIDDLPRGAGGGVEASELMVEAAIQAGADTGAPHLLSRAQHVAVPQGMWRYADPARLIADRIGASAATTVLAEIGILQQDVLTDACLRIASGEIDVAVLVGGEAKYRSLQAQIAGVDLGEHQQPAGTVADRIWKAPTLGVHDVEILRHAVDPSTSYALIEHAIGHRRGQTPVDHAGEVGQLWARFGAIASTHADAWDRSAPSAEIILDPTAAGNRMIASPYTKLCCSQWNVDQAVALVLCSAAAAEEHGVPRDRWVFPHASAESNHAVPVVERAELGRCLGAEIAVARALDLAGTSDDELSFIDLYSCFPAAVQVYADALGLVLDDPRGLTVTGGMTFFGGPLNSYVLHALATMVPLLRADPDARGLSSSVSGFLVKQGFSVWSASPPATSNYQHADVTIEVANEMGASNGTVPVDADHTGDATIASWTVVHTKGAATRAVAICDTPGGTRTVATSTDPDVLTAMLDGTDWIGHPVHLPHPDTFKPLGA